MSKRGYNNSGYMAKRAFGDIFSRIGSIFGSIPIIGTFGGIIDILKSNNPNKNLSSQLTSMFADTPLNNATPEQQQMIQDKIAKMPTSLADNVKAFLKKIGDDLLLVPQQPY